MELRRQQFCVGDADPKADDGADIAEDGVEHRPFDLRGVLMGERQRQIELARLGEDFSEGEGADGLELIDDKV